MRTMNVTGRRLSVLCATLLVVGLSACGGDDSGGGSAATTTAGATATTAGATGTSAAGGGAIAVTIEGFAFDAKPVTADQPFEVENKDGTAHTFTADDGAFDVHLAAGATESVDGLAAGTYAFHCTIHSSMKGTLQVG